MVVWQEDVDRLRSCVAAIGAEFRAGFGGHTVVDGMNNVVLGSEQIVGLHFLQRLGNGLLTEGTPDLL